MYDSHYNIYEHIKSHCSDTIQHNVLFLNTINRIEKQALFNKFRINILDNYMRLKKCYDEYHKGKLHPNKESIIVCLLDDFYHNHDNKDIITIANNFGAIIEYIFKQKHLFDERFHKDVKIAKDYSQAIIETLIVFEKILTCFIDFDIQQNNNQHINENELETLKNKVRNEINKDDINLSKTAFSISHIINNAYFSNTPNNEIKYLTDLLNEYRVNKTYQQYKSIIDKYESYSKDQRFSNAIMHFIPFHRDIFLEFFSKDDFDELCKFILFLIDLETGGVFLYYMHTLSLLLERVNNISKEDLQKIITKDFDEKFQSFKEYKAIEYLTSYIKNSFVATLVELFLKQKKTN